jgi:hypothetical protein
MLQENFWKMVSLMTKILSTISQISLILAILVAIVWFVLSGKTDLAIVCLLLLYTNAIAYKR